jgi:hypothetical protein
LRSEHLDFGQERARLSLKIKFASFHEALSRRNSRKYIIEKDISFEFGTALLSFLDFEAVEEQYAVPLMNRTCKSIIYFTS